MDDNIASFVTRGRIGKWFARRIMGNYNFPNFDFHIANSAYTAEEFYESVGVSNNKRRANWFMNACWQFFKAPRVPVEDRIFVCPRGVDTETFTPRRKSSETRQKIRSLAGVPDDAVLLLYAGRISPEKNIKLLADMMRLLAGDATDFRLLVAGDGPKREWLKTQTDKFFPGKIIQLGHLPKNELADVYANVDIFVHPNPREPFGIAPLEAMASGVPTVAPNSGGILSYATDENAWLVEPSAEKFAKAVRDVIADPATTAYKVEAALQTAGENTRIASTDNLLATYDKIYHDFRSRNPLFTDVEAAKTFDFMELVKTVLILSVVLINF
jgi:glycosyltransferase involved in cell wall biosynthesis